MPSRQSFITVEEPHERLVRVTFSGTVDDKEFESYLSTYGRVLQRGGKRVVVLDATHAGAPTASQRKRQAEWQKENAALLGVRVLGFAFAIDSAVIRGALTAILWLSPLPAPHYVASSAREALLWAEGTLEKHGLPRG